MHLILTDGKERALQGGLTQTACRTSRNQKPTSMVRLFTYSSLVMFWNFDPHNSDLIFSSGRSRSDFEPRTIITSDYVSVNSKSTHFPLLGYLTLLKIFGQIPRYIRRLHDQMLW